MLVTLSVPEDVAEQLGATAEALSRAALEGLALEAVRTRKLTVAQARRLLGISSRYEMDGFLKLHGVLLETTAEDVDREAELALSFAK